ncbi:MAG: hypothetical protein ABJK64_16975 [Paraglaciecola sp.]|uniref:hypothetical protein n=1 Tax=Paraglaciecola sp. TaxID=1920173 RepID=UPI00329748D5
MKYFSKEGVSSSQITGAVAEAAIYDLRVNNFAFAGFPQISVPDPIDNIYTITLSWQSHNVNIKLTFSEAVAAAKRFNAQEEYDPIILDRIQEALASIERKISA